MIELNDQQKEVLRLSEKWYKNQTKQTFEFSGPAGSGKTTIVKILIDNLNLQPEEVMYMAYVGKATLALIRGGVPQAQTIHSSIYDITEEYKTDDEGNIILKDNKPIRSIAFYRKPNLAPEVKLLVVDEASMVNREIARDILSFNLPIIAIGDLNQLQPVFGEAYFLKNPDAIITKIMRQMENDPIIYLSQLALQNKYIDIGKYGPKCFVIEKEHILDDFYTKSDIVICGTNKTRDRINKYVRNNIMNIYDPYPTIGEKLICRQNNWSMKLDNIFLVNGLVGYVKDVHLETFNKKSLDIDFRPEFLDDYFEDVPLDYKYLFDSYKEKSNKRSYYNKFEFGYCITAHLAQGSQYDKVLVYDEKSFDKEYYRRWLYTAITRAKSTLILAK